LDTKIAIPKALKGSGNGADPKELLVSSAAACYVETLTAILENRKLPVEDHSLQTEATLFNNELKISHFPKIVLSADATEAQVQSAKRTLKAADRACNVGNLLKKAGVDIELQGNVFLK